MNSYLKYVSVKHRARLPEKSARRIPLANVPKPLAEVAKNNRIEQSEGQIACCTSFNSISHVDDF